MFTASTTVYPLIPIKVLLKDSAEHSLPNLLADSEKYSQQLDTFRKNIHAIVNNWMHHYCKAVGINIDTPLFSRPSSRAGLHSRGVSSRSRMVKSSMSYATGMYGSFLCWTFFACVRVCMCKLEEIKFSFPQNYLRPLTTTVATCSQLSKLTG